MIWLGQVPQLLMGKNKNPLPFAFIQCSSLQALRIVTSFSKESESVMQNCYNGRQVSTSKVFWFWFCFVDGMKGRAYGERMQLVKETQHVKSGGSLEEQRDIEAQEGGQGRPQNSEEQQERIDGGIPRTHHVFANILRTQTLFFLLTDSLLIDLDTDLLPCFHNPN